MSKVLRAALLVLVVNAEARGTAIAVIRTPTFIVIAADSRTTNARGEQEPGRECKIRKVGRFFYAPNKFVGDALSGYDLFGIVSGIVDESIETVAAKLKDAIVSPLTRALSRSRNDDSLEFRRNFSGRQALGVLLAGIDQGEPTVIDLRFNIEDLEAKTIALQIDEHRCPGVDCPEGYAMVLVASRPQVKEKFEREHPEYWLGSAAVVAANAAAFINTAIHEKLTDVGPPISTLVIDWRGSVWQERGGCKE